MKNFFNAVAKLFKTDPNKIGEDGCTRLQRAIINGDDKKAQDLIKAGADVNMRGDLIFPPLHLALQKDRHGIAEALIKAGADTNLQDAEGRTPLHIAASQSQEYLMRQLLRYNADPNIKDNDGRTPLHVMATARPSMVGLLVENKARVNERDNDGNTPLHIFIRQQAVVESLLRHGASPLMKNRAGISPYQTVLADDSLLKDGYLLRLLIQHGANLDETNNGGETLLHRAARLDLPDVFSRIFSRSDLSAKDANGNNVLHALTRNRNIEMIERVLKSAPELLHEKNNGGRTPLNRMMQRFAETHKVLVSFDRFETAAMMMVRAGADVNTADDTGETLLHYAVQNARLPFTEFVIAAKADLNAQDKWGRAPLHIAVDKKNMEMLDRLLDAGADPDLTDSRGWTLLDRLAEKNDRESPVVQRLIVAGGQYNKMLPLNPDQMRQKKPSSGHLDKKPGRNGGLNL